MSTPTDYVAPLIPGEQQGLKLANGAALKTAPVMVDVKEVHANGVNGTKFNSVHQLGEKHKVPLNPNLAFTPRKLRVVTIGAGFSGLLMAHRLQHRFPEMQDIVEHTIFEARHKIGGTWLVNTYPGVQCDVPAHTYVST
jgi:hypothetical protein